MAKVIQNIGSEANQKHTILFGESEIILNLRFYPRTTSWFMDVSYGLESIFGVKLSIGVLHLLSNNLPFDFVVRDLSGRGIDPFRRKDFSEGRCELYLLDSDDMEDIRGVPVPQ